MTGYTEENLRDYEYKGKEIAECLGRDPVAVTEYIRRGRIFGKKWKD
jgi:hypothetical protein